MNTHTHTRAHTVVIPGDCDALTLVTCVSCWSVLSVLSVPSCFNALLRCI